MKGPFQLVRFLCALAPVSEWEEVEGDDNEPPGTAWLTQSILPSLELYHNSLGSLSTPSLLAPISPSLRPFTPFPTLTSLRDEKVIWI